MDEQARAVLTVSGVIACGHRDHIASGKRPGRYLDLPKLQCRSSRHAARERLRAERARCSERLGGPSVSRLRLLEGPQSYQHVQMRSDRAAFGRAPHAHTRTRRRLCDRACHFGAEKDLLSGLAGVHSAIDRLHHYSRWQQRS